MMHDVLRTDHLLLQPDATADAPRLIAINEPTTRERTPLFVDDQLSWLAE